jgi:hypothetical protein
MLPHPPIFLSDIRPTDIWLLLAVGAAWELLQRLVRLLLGDKRVSQFLRRRAAQVSVLQAEVEALRRRGPAAFVDCSKLERRLLREERDLARLREQRQQRAAKLDKVLGRYGNYLLYAIVFVAYYGVPLLTLEGLDSALLVADGDSSVLYSRGDSYVTGGSYWKALLFPISFVGLGMKMSKWGMPQEAAPASLGALAVLWSAQMTMAHAMDAVEACFV